VVTLDVLLLDAARIDEMQPTEFENELRDRLANLELFQADPAGNWKYHNKSTLKAFKQMAHLVRHHQEALERLVGEDQVAAVDALYTEYDSRLGALSEKVGELREVADDSTKADDLLRNGCRELEDEYFGKLYREVLFDAQRQWLVDFLRNREIRRLGVLGMLYLESDEEGKLFTDDDRQEMREVLKREIGELRTAVVDQYYRSIDQQVDQLPDSIRHELKEALGERPELMLPSLILLADRVHPAGASDAGKR
jgi:hypothetical protein